MTEISYDAISVNDRKDWSTLTRLGEQIPVAGYSNDWGNRFMYIVQVQVTYVRLHGHVCLYVTCTYMVTNSGNSLTFTRCS